MARSEKKAKRRINPFDVVVVLLVIGLLATFVYRIYKGVEDKSDSETSKYVLTFTCVESIDSLAEYLDKGTPVYLQANNEILGYVYDGKDRVSVSIYTEGESTTDESETSSDASAAEEITSAEEKLPYNKADIHGKIHLSEDVKVYNNGVYYSIGDVNFAPGSKLTVFTEEAVFTIVVESITQIDK